MKLRDYQDKAVGLLWRYFDNNSGNPVVEAPTGAGKSVIQAEFIRRAVETFPQTRALALCHVKELVDQNSKALRRAMPGGDIGICSSGLNSHDTGNAVVFGGIQTAAHRVNELGRFDLVFVDECHLVPNKSGTQYRQTIERLRLFNPKLKVIGFSATPYRLDGGLLTYGDDRLFTDLISAESAGMSIMDLLKNGYLAPLRTVAVESKFDVEGIGLRGGDYRPGELSKAVHDGDVTERCLEEVIEKGADRKSWLLFATDVDHAHRIESYLRERGIATSTITGATPDGLRNQRVAQFREGRLRALVNVNVLTTGFDAPATDLLAFLRPTASTGLYVQACGRGMRIADGKDDCLVLDFAGNIERHGPVDKVRPKLKRGQKGEPPMRECDNCGALVMAALRECPECGKAFIIEGGLKLSDQASALAILSDQHMTQQFHPTKVRVRIHTKQGSPAMLRVDWFYGIRVMASEWVCLFHSGYAKQRAIKWWRDHVGGELPEDIEEALERAKEPRLPSTMTVRQKGKYFEVYKKQFSEIGLPPSPVQPAARAVRL